MESDFSRADGNKTKVARRDETAEEEGKKKKKKFPNGWNFSVRLFAFGDTGYFFG